MSAKYKNYVMTYFRSPIGDTVYCIKVPEENYDKQKVLELQKYFLKGNITINELRETLGDIREFRIKEEE